MANQLLTISMITKEALMILENNLVFVKRIRRDFDDKYGIAGAKIGTVLNVRKPPRYIGRLGQALQLEDAIETSVPVPLAFQRGCDIAFTSQDLALSIDDFSERFINPAIANIANNVDFDCLGLMFNVYNEIGTPGTIPKALLTYLQAQQRLDEEAVPRDGDRTIMMSPAMQAVIVDALKGLFQSSSKIKEQYEKGEMGETIGAEWFMDQNIIARLTVGLGGGAPVVTVGGQSGNSLLTSGWPNTTAILSQGDIITIANVFAVNPQNRQSTGVLRQFVVTAPVISGGGGLATIPIACVSGFGLIGAGPFQTVNTLPLANAAIVINGAASTNTPRGLKHRKIKISCSVRREREILPGRIMVG
jgi:hypothetical protein